MSSRTRVLLYYHEMHRSLAETARITGLSYGRVRRIALGAGVLRTKEDAQHILHRERLSWRAQEAGRLRAEGKRRAEIAARLGVSVATVSAYIHHHANPYENGRGRPGFATRAKARRAA